MEATGPDRKTAGRHATGFVCVTVALDAMGIGIIMPVMPDLIRELTDLPIGPAALWGGYLTFVYAVMQFAFGPTVGNLSDRFGRRPVLIASLAALAVDYLVMGLAPSLWLLFVGRLLAGIAGATHSTANAFVADVTPPARRASAFGLVGAAFGVGFILGPVVGGLAGELGTRAPFFVAASLAFANLCYGAAVLPESLDPARRRRFSWARANPLGAAAQVARLPKVAWLVAAFFLFGLAHYVYPAIWAFYAKAAFAWGSAEIGLSLALVGVGFVVVQGGLIRLVLPRLGEARTAWAGFVLSIAGLLWVAFATEGWMALAVIPVVALGAVVTPALTGLMANATPDDAQGELQGLLASVTAVTMIVTPLFATQLFGHFTDPAVAAPFPGAPFLAAAIVMTLALVPFAIGLRRVPS